MNKMFLVLLLVLIAVVLLLGMLALGYSRNWGVSGEATSTPTSEFPALGALLTWTPGPIATPTLGVLLTRTPLPTPIPPDTPTPWCDFRPCPTPIIPIIATFLAGFPRTPTPTLALMPTEIPPAFMTNNDYGIISQEPCGLPCFQGITPGVTAFDDAVRILHATDAGCTVQDWTDEEERSGKVMICNAPDTEINIIAYTGYGPNLVVSEIDLDPPVEIAVGDFIARYGPPDSTFPTYDGEQADMALLYDRLHTYVVLTLQQDKTYTLTPSTTISVLGYQTAAAYEHALSAIWSEDRRQPWKGYGTYTPSTSP